MGIVKLKVNELPTPAIFEIYDSEPPTGTKKKNKVKIKKMVIADPGLAVEIDIDWGNDAEKVKSLVFDFSITLIKDGNRSQSYQLNWYLTGKSASGNNPSQPLYLPVGETLSYVFVFPFVDEHYDKEVDDYECEVTLGAYKANSNGHYNIKDGFKRTIMGTAESSPKKLGIITVNGTAVGIPPSNHAPESNIEKINYYNIYCHQEGIFWNESYTDDNLPTTWIYLRRSNDHGLWSGGKPLRLNTEIPDNYSFCFIPYVKIGDDGTVNPQDYELYAQDPEGTSSGKTVLSVCEYVEANIEIGII